MHKGTFTQTVCVLLEKVVTIEQIEAVLAGAEFVVRQRVEANEEWVFGGPTLVVDYWPEVNGFVAVDLVEQCWPDHMGDPKEDSMLFSAWSMGHFGPFAYPGGLQRAKQQCWAWEEGQSSAERHKAFIRIRSSYAFGAKDDDPVMPDEYEALPELEFVTKLASALLDLPGAICYFNPNGEVLHNQDSLRESLNFGWTHNLPPFDAWMNIRLFNVNEQWALMDSVGSGQLDFSDTEAIFHVESYNPGEVSNFLRNVSLYLLNNGEVIEPGDTMDGPGGIRWQSHPFENGVCSPPRPVLRWQPMDDRPLPPEITDKST